MLFPTNLTISLKTRNKYYFKLHRKHESPKKLIYTQLSIYTKVNNLILRQIHSLISRILKKEKKIPSIHESSIHLDPITLISSISSNVHVIKQVRAQWGVFRSILHHPKENLQQFMKESSPTFDFNDNNDNRSNNDGLWLPFPSARQRRRRRRRKIYEREERNIPKGRRLINGGGNFSLPPRTSATSLYHGSSSKRGRQTNWNDEGCCKACEKKTGKTSSLKLKEAKIGILLPKLSVVAPGGCFETDCLLALSPPLPLPSTFFLWLVLVSSLEQINSWMFIRKLRG